MNRVIKGVVLLLLLAGLVAGITVGLPMFRETFTSIAVAAVNLSPGMQIRDGMVAMRMWRRDEVPEGAVFSLEGIMGKYASVRVAKDQPVSLRQVTTVTPPPVRLSSRAGDIYTGYNILSFQIPRRDAANLFVGDRVDVTLPYCASTKRNVAVEEVTIRRGWRVVYIDHNDRAARAMLNSVVYLRISTNDLRETLTRPMLAPPHGTTRMFKSDR